MLTILFYSPFNNRSRDTESLMLAFKEQGHRVLSLNQSPGNFIHDFLKSKGILTFSFVLNSSKNFWYHLRHITYFIWFCRKHKVDVVYSHLEPANFVSTIGQYFIPSRVFVCRHHLDMFSFSDNKPGLTYYLTYRLAKKIIVVSQATKNYMVQHEKVREDKIIVINLAYDFKLYPDVDRSFVRTLREKIPSNLVLITVGQLIPIKRPDLSIRVLRMLIEKGVNAKLIFLGKGETESMCTKLAQELGVADKVIFCGHVPNVLDYIAYSTVLLHPSISESSCVVVKEAGLVDKPVIVCKGIGDFDEYIEHSVNGFSVSSDAESFVRESVEIIRRYYNNAEELDAIGKQLGKTIATLFHIDRVIDAHTRLINSLIS